MLAGVTVLTTLDGSVGTDCDVAGSEGAVVVTTGVEIVTGAVVGAGGAIVAIAIGGTTDRLRHSPWLPDVSIAETWIETLAVRWPHCTVALVSAVSSAVKPLALTTYSFTATLSWLLSQATEMAVSALETRWRLLTADGGRVSGVADLAAEAGGVQPGIFAVEGFAAGVTAAIREMPGLLAWGTATIPLRALGTAITVAEIPRAAMRSTCQCRGTRQGYRE